MTIYEKLRLRLVTIQLVLIAIQILVTLGVPFVVVELNTRLNSNIPCYVPQTK